jgi:hypothetical protein
MVNNKHVIFIARVQVTFLTFFEWNGYKTFCFVFYSQHIYLLQVLHQAGYISISKAENFWLETIVYKHQQG